MHILIKNNACCLVIVVEHLNKIQHQVCCIQNVQKVLQYVSNGGLTIGRMNILRPTQYGFQLADDILNAF